MASKFPKKGTENGVVMLRDHLGEVHKRIAAIAGTEVLVGVPESTTERDADSDEFEVTNAALAYIHDNGAPEVNIPARPFMLPGIKTVEEDIAGMLVNTADASVIAARVLETNKEANRRLHAVGIKAASAIRAYVQKGVDPPLSEYTLRKRAARGRKGAKQELENRAKGLPPSTDLAKPLMDTNEMVKSLTYVIRNRSERK